jgi:hypothetical protein
MPGSAPTQPKESAKQHYHTAAAAQFKGSLQAQARWDLRFDWSLSKPAFGCHLIMSWAILRSAGRNIYIT